MNLSIVVCFAALSGKRLTVLRNDEVLGRLTCSSVVKTSLKLVIDIPLCCCCKCSNVIPTVVMLSLVAFLFGQSCTGGVRFSGSGIR